MLSREVGVQRKGCYASSASAPAKPSKDQQDQICMSYNIMVVYVIEYSPEFVVIYGVQTAFPVCAWG